MRNYGSNLYLWMYNLLVPILILGFFGILIITGITHNPKIFSIGCIILSIIGIIGMIYLWFDWYDIKFWWKTKFKYKLNINEKLLWDSLIQKAQLGYDEWLNVTKGNDFCGPWIKNYTEDENNLLDKIHKYFYGDDWYVSMPISGAQVNYIMLQDLKDKVK
jgi:hypothetical protein